MNFRCLLPYDSTQLLKPDKFSKLVRFLLTYKNKYKYLLNITFFSIRKYIHFYLHLNIVVKLKRLFYIYFYTF